MTTSRSGLLPQIILPEVICEKFEGPCGHDNPSFGIFAPNLFCRTSFLRNLKAPAGMTTRRSGLLPQTFFAGSHHLRKQQHYLMVFQWCSRKHTQNVVFNVIWS